MSTNFDTLLRSLRTYQQLVSSGPALTAGTRHALDFSNSTDGDLWYIPFLELQFSSGPPAAGTIVMDFYRIPGSTEVTERFAEGGNGTVGADVTPADTHYVGGFQIRQPSTSIDRILSLDAFSLRAGGNRFVFENVSANTIRAGWTFGIALERLRQAQV